MRAVQVDPDDIPARVAIVPLKIVQFLAVVLTALALVPGGAPVFALPTKIDLGAVPPAAETAEDIELAVGPRRVRKPAVGRFHH